MRQETGSKSYLLNDYVSIQLKLDGHSFSLAECNHSAVAEGAEIVNVLVVSPKSMLVPTEEFDAQSTAQMLAANAMACADDEIAVCGVERDGVASIVALKRSLYDELHTRLGGRERIYTPLTLDEQSATRQNIVELYGECGLLYIKVYGQKLRFADVFSVANDDDILYIMAKLGEQYAIESYDVHITGDDAEHIKERLKQYFRVVCA